MTRSPSTMTHMCDVAGQVRCCPAADFALVVRTAQVSSVRYRSSRRSVQRPGSTGSSSVAFLRNTITQDSQMPKTTVPIQKEIEPFHAKGPGLEDEHGDGQDLGDDLPDADVGQPLGEDLVAVVAGSRSRRRSRPPRSSRVIRRTTAARGRRATRSARGSRSGRKVAVRKQNATSRQPGQRADGQSRPCRRRPTPSPSTCASCGT